jgi:cyanophycinase
MGFLLLEGGAEFGGRMAEPDQQAIALAGGNAARIRIIPTAAAPDNNHQRAGNNGVRWFQSLGATNVAALPIIDHAAAADPHMADELRAARLIYMLGGFPAYLAQTLAGSACWRAAQEAYQTGAVLAGSSAGAMALCEYLYDPQAGKIMAGLGAVPGCCVLPHHNTFGKSWAARLGKLLPAATLLGIDERTGMLDDGTGDCWTVYGHGGVTIYHGEQTRAYGAGEQFMLHAD